MSQQGRNHLVGFRPPRTSQSAGAGRSEEKSEPVRRGFKLPTLRGALVPPLNRAAREERAIEREQQRTQASVDAARQAFFETPAGRARLAYKRGHHLFQYELEVSAPAPTIVPGHAGHPARLTTDPVDILNSVTAEGWKLVTGKFIHSEMRSGAVGVYLFKRSQKRRQQMNDPWQVPTEAPTAQI